MSDFTTAYNLLARYDPDKWKQIPPAKQKLLTNKLIEVRNLLALSQDLGEIKDDFEYLLLDKEAGARTRPVLGVSK